MRQELKNVLKIRRKSVLVHFNALILASFLVIQKNLISGIESNNQFIVSIIRFTEKEACKLHFCRSYRLIMTVFELT